MSIYLYLFFSALQSYCSRTIADRLDSDWIEKDTTGSYNPVSIYVSKYNHIMYVYIFGNCKANLFTVSNWLCLFWFYLIGSEVKILTKNYFRQECWPTEIRMNPRTPLHNMIKFYFIILTLKMHVPGFHWSPWWLQPSLSWRWMPLFRRARREAVSAGSLSGLPFFATWARWPTCRDECPAPSYA